MQFRCLYQLVNIHQDSIPPATLAPFTALLTSLTHCLVRNGAMQGDPSDSWQGMALDSVLHTLLGLTRRMGDVGGMGGEVVSGLEGAVGGALEGEMRAAELAVLEVWVQSWVLLINAFKILVAPWVIYLYIILCGIYCLGLVPASHIFEPID